MALRSALLFVVALLLAGCATPEPSGSSKHTDVLPPTKAVEGLGLPFDAYTASLAELYMISNAEDQLTHECMKARGYDWEIIERPTDLKDLRNRRRYGVVEIQIAQRFGYHVPAGLLTPVEVERQYDRRESGLTESQSEAALGEGGCLREALKQLRPDSTPDMNPLRRLSRESLEDSQKDARVAEALRSWKECVHSMGFDYEDPFDAVSDPQWFATEAAEPSSRETAVAVADVRCKERTGLVEVWHAAEVRIQAEKIAHHADYFQELGNAKEKELAIASAVLAQSVTR